MKIRLRVGVLFLLPLLTCSVAAADTFLWSTTNATYGLLSGSATFTTVADGSGYDLQIVLDNTSTNPATQSAQILEGLFFNIELTSNGSELQNATGMKSATATLGTLNGPGYVPTSGTAGADICASGTGSGTAKNPTCVTVTKGWEDAYNTAGYTLNSVHYGDEYGIGDAGWGVFQGAKVGNPTNGIAPGGKVGIGSNPNGSMKFPFVYGTATFVLYGLTTDKIKFANVEAAYGTGPEAMVAAAYYSPAPEPGTPVTILAGGLLLLLVKKRRKGSPVRGRAL